MTSVLRDRVIVVGVTGGIAAYKAAELCRLFRKAGADVHVIMTPAACEFITPLTMEVLSDNPVASDMFARRAKPRVEHVELASAADILVVAPATADAIARFSIGMANDLLSAVVLATRAPILLAPAMNTKMWENPITQANLSRLLQMGNFSAVGPGTGYLAEGSVGAGRMAEPTDILVAAERALSQAPEVELVSRSPSAVGDGS